MSLGIALASLVLASQRGHDLNFKNEWPLLATGFAGLIVLSMDYTAAFQDAMRAVVEFNEGREHNFSMRHADAPQ